jgi:hypothetical protein
MSDILALGQQWPDGYANNKFWISINMMRPMTQHGSGGLVLGRECSSVEELEMVADEIRADLDRLIQEARKKFGTGSS